MTDTRGAYSPIALRHPPHDAADYASQRTPTRRRFISDAAALAGVGLVSTDIASLLAIRPAAATPESMRRAISQVVGEAPVHKGKVKLDIPPLVESGNSVSITVMVESPMTATDYVKAIHVFNEQNPLPNVVSARLGPRAGRARLATRIRLADTQTVTAIAELADGSFWSDSAQVIVTLPACTERL
jgi:sulfur-oxidizing protein SoxY